MLVKYRPHSMFRSPLWGASELNRVATDLSLSNRYFDRAMRVNSGSSLGVSWDASEDAVTVSAELPGFNPDSITIELSEGKRLTLSGTNASAADENEEMRYLRRERSEQSFEKSFALPFSVDADAVSAEFANGILTIHLPRAEADKPRQITVTKN